MNVIVKAEDLRFIIIQINMRNIFVRLIFYYLKTTISYKVNFFEDVGEIRSVSEYSLKNSKKIVSATTNILYNFNKSQFSLINFRNLFSSKNNYNNWIQLRVNSSILIYKVLNKKFKKINLWRSSKKAFLSSGIEQKNPKKESLTTKMSLFTKVDFKPSVIEKIILDSLEPFFEGSWSWFKITKKEYQKIKNKFKVRNHTIKKNKKGYFKKYWKHKIKFYSFNYGFRCNRSIHDVLKTIQQWKIDTIWIIKCSIHKTFNTINKRRLKNIFLSYINEFVLWKEIEKMINIGSLDFDFCLQKHMEGSALSRFLFNIYLTEFDSFMKQLSKKFVVPVKKLSFEARQKYKQLINEFNFSRIKHITIKYGSIQRAKSVFKNKKKTYYKKWYVDFTNTCSNFLQYIRYAHFFLIGMGSSKKRALSIQQQINTFIKSNLHLKIKKNELINRNKNFVLFLGFRVYLAPFYHNICIKWKNYKNITKKYHNQVRIYFKRISTITTKTIVSSLKFFLIESFHTYISKYIINYNKKDIKKLISVLINQLVSQSYGLTTRKLPVHFKRLANQNAALSLQFYYNQIVCLLVPENQRYYLKILELKNQFFTALKKLQSKNRLFFIKNQKTDILNKTDDSINKLQMYNSNKKVGQVFFKAPIKALIENLIKKGFYHAVRRISIAQISVINFNDAAIIRFYLKIINNFIYYYWPTNNFVKVKKLTYNLRQSCYLTLAYKHKKSFIWAYNTYGKSIMKNFASSKILTTSKINTYVIGLNTAFTVFKNCSFGFNTKLKKYSYYDNFNNKIQNYCLVLGCLNKRVKINFKFNLIKKNKLKHENSNYSNFVKSVNQRQLFLCLKHYLEFEKNNFSNLDKIVSKRIYNKKIPNNKLFRKIFTVSK